MLESGLLWRGTNEPRGLVSDLEDEEVPRFDDEAKALELGVVLLP